MKIKDLITRAKRMLKRTGRRRSGYHSRWAAARRAMKKAGAWDGNPRDWCSKCPCCGAMKHEGIEWMKEHPALVDAEMKTDARRQTPDAGQEGGAEK